MHFMIRPKTAGKLFFRSKNSIPITSTNLIYFTANFECFLEAHYNDKKLPNEF